jgi:3-phenylpropionate/trans-cinnamate dioxygenase ferredoxin component
MSDYRTVAQTSDIDPGEVLLVTFGRMMVLLFNVNGTYYAIEDRCSHADVELSGGTIDLNTCQIQCPKHGAEFDIKTGAALSPPAIAPVMTFDVRVEGQNIQLARKTRRTS